MKQTDINIKKAKPGDKRRKLFDGGGLFLQIEPTGGKLWRYKYQFAGKEKLLAFGKYPDVSLQEVRKRHQEARKQLAKGVDPSAAKQAHKTAGKERSANSFEVIAREWYEVWKTDKNETHAYIVATQLKKHAFPYIGNRPVSELSVPEVLSVLRRLEEYSIDAAHRMRTNISLVMRYAVSTGRADRDPCNDLRGALKPRPKKKNFAAPVEPAQVAALLRAIDLYRGGTVVRAALRLAPLLFVRPGELRMMKWAEIDLEQAQWNYVSTKREKEITVPLARQAVKILKDLLPVTGSNEYVFINTKGRGYIAPGTLRLALRSLGYTGDEVTVHGFRAMARTMLDEVLRMDPRLIEFEMTHSTGDPLKYNRARYIDDRRRMMQSWADYLDDLKAADFSKVISFQKAI